MARRLSTEDFINRVKKSNLAMYENCDYSDTKYSNLKEKVEVMCKMHGKFLVWPGDHMKGMHGCKQCIANKRKLTIQEKYGVDNFFKRTDLVEQAMQEKHGVKNPGQLKDHVEKIKRTNVKKYGEEYLKTWATKRKNTNLERYGVTVPSMLPEISKKATRTKIKKGSFTKSNSSKEATAFIREYISKHNFSLDQCAFADSANGLFEWGIYHNNRWVLFDLVVFESGHRGNKDRILEILEYHGPFHYTDTDVQLRGDDFAYPWKSNKTTIRESVSRDKEKEKLAKTLTNKYTIIWAKNYKR